MIDNFTRDDLVQWYLFKLQNKEVLDFESFI